MAKNLDETTINRVVPGDYGPVLETIVEKIKAAQTRAIRTVNFELITVYRDIGQIIHDKQNKAGWGASVVERLAEDLKNRFPAVKGFSSRNLWRMKDFYLSYGQKEKLTALLAEISWTHHVYILEKCKDPLEREFYIRMSKRNGWSYRTLLNQIENKAFERMIASQENFKANLPAQVSQEAKLSVKDEYAFDFLGLGDEYSERELEGAVGRNIESFLREVGHAYTFVGSQYRLEVSGQEFFVDILLYHRKLKSLVAIELKRGAFIPEYVGKMGSPKHVVLRSKMTSV
jgi:predicted nuclease of restriction endonuclease-like (RecB) superfamily